MDIGSDSIVWHTRMRIERTRFEYWGRTLEFLNPKTGEQRQPGNQDVLDLGGILQIEAARGLVEDILKSVERTLSEFDKAAERYQPVPSSSAAEAAAARKRHRLKLAWGQTKGFAKHLVLIMKDERDDQGLTATTGVF